MENLISSDMIGCVIALLAFALGMTVTAKASKRRVGQQRGHPVAQVSQQHFSERKGGARGPSHPGAEAAVSESPREWCRPAYRAPAHGKEYTP